ncbi:6551_t:CDS:2, partial [Racocetra fulgida]
MPIKRTRTTSTSAESNSASKSARASQTLNTYGKREQEHVAADTEEDLMQIDKSRSANVESPQGSPRLGIQDSQDSQMDLIEGLNRVSIMPPRTPRYHDEDDEEKTKQKIGQKVTTPTKINNFVPCKFIATGDHHSIATNMDDKLYSWGFGEPFGSGDEEKKEPYLLS